MKLDLRTFGRILESINSLPQSKRINRADNTSSYSDLHRWKIHPELLKSAAKVRLVVVTISLLGLNPIQEIDLKTTIRRVCDKFNYQGEWEKVNKLLDVIRLPLIKYLKHT